MAPGRHDVLSMVLAGGEGKRLMPLTRDRAKPAVPVRWPLPADRFRAVQSGQRWPAPHRGPDPVQEPFAQRASLEDLADVDAARQLRDLGPCPDAARAEMVPGLGRRHLSEPESGRGRQPRVPVRVRSRPHLPHGSGPDAHPTHRVRGRSHGGGNPGPNRSGLPVRGDREGASNRIERFREKPSDAQPVPDDPGSVLASMGNYVFTTKVLLDQLAADADDEGSRHDIGGNLLPRMVDSGFAEVYDFTHNEVPGVTDRERGYWRDVGTLDSYFDAHMDLTATEPIFNLYNEQWPIFTASTTAPPAKVVAVAEHGSGQVADSILSNGVILSGAYVRNSVLSPNVRVDPGSDRGRFDPSRGRPHRKRLGGAKNGHRQERDRARSVPHRGRC